MEPDMILTPGAKDVLRNLGVTIKFGVKPCEVSCKVQDQSLLSESLVNVDSSEESAIECIKSQVINMLRNDYDIKDTKVMTEILKHVLGKL